MNTIESIKVEIERLKKEYHSWQLKLAMDELLAKLDTLQEQPVDLEKEIDDYYEMYRDEKGIARDKDNGEICCDWKTGGREISIRLMARHFYELGRKSKGAEWTEKDIENGSYISAFLQANCGNNVILKEATMWFMSRLRQLPIQQSKVQPVCEDLKKRVSEIYPNKEGDLYSLHSTLQRGGYIRGYQDCKEEMMKEAVEGEIINAGYPTKIELNTFYSKFEHGQEVKLIIIKED